MQSLWELDQSIFRQIHLGWHQDWLDPVFWVISSSGLGWVQTLLILAALPWKRAYAERGKGFFAFFGTPRRFKKADFAPFVLPLLLTLTVASIVNTGILKKVIPRDRPSNLPDAIAQEGFKYSSFPSGHTATSFAIATALLFLTWGTSRSWLGQVAMVWAVLVGISRIYRGVHWPSDVLGGALVGIGSAALVAMALKRTPTKAFEA